MHDHRNAGSQQSGLDQGFEPHQVIQRMVEDGEFEILARYQLEFLQVGFRYAAGKGSAGPGFVSMLDVGNQGQLNRDIFTHRIEAGMPCPGNFAKTKMLIQLL